MRVGLGHAQQEILGASIERLADEHHVIFCRHLHTGGRSLCTSCFGVESNYSCNTRLVIYASKRRLGATMNLHVLEAVSSAEQAIQPQRTHALAARSFRPYGEVSFPSARVADPIFILNTGRICPQGCL